ncbi:hypothetical protein GCM10011591_26630 [Nocardia camponoti]|uniref:Uncharacterized protein n=1 Tax=Nocardia camponoti TaxID=1616106 RepID=A0A917QJL3_9NOCA|nr:hypothetical protein GCM10011591_26630 [Nocardia camponoti]
MLDEVWRELDGVGALSGPNGGPLRRTVKLILDPLVLRPMQHRLCAPSILTADGVTLVESLLLTRADTLRACAAWFTVLKQTRRALRITEGNAQDLYFQRCFELAVVHGEPGLAARSVAEATLREIHESTGGLTTSALKHFVAEHDSRLRELLDLAWSRRPLASYDPRDQARPLLELLDACTLFNSGDPADAGPLLVEAMQNRAGTHRGIALWNADATEGADELGLSAFETPGQPGIGASASTATLALPLDRTIFERVFTVLQASVDRTELPDLAELVTTEITRSCAPWGLLDESLRLAGALGCELALGLAPIDGLSQPRERVGVGDDGPSRAHEQVNGRWRREAYVLVARRYSVHGGAGPLAVVAAELRAPWRPYLRRLWVRLHGRDVREYALYEPGEVWDLLDGVARSVMLDHRDRIRRALTVDGRSIEAKAS